MFRKHLFYKIKFLKSKYCSKAKNTCMETTPKIHFSTIRLPCKSWQRTEDCSIAFHLMSPEPTDFLPTKRQSAYFSCTHQFHVALTEKLFITCFKTFMFVSRSQAKATAPQKQAVLRFLLILKKLLPQKKKIKNPIQQNLPNSHKKKLKLHI